MTEAFVYKWTDSINDKFYVGYHQGTPDDGYTHSSSVWPHFKSNNIPEGVSREIIATGSAEDMLQLEYKILNEAFDSGNWDQYYNVVRAYPNFSHVPVKQHTDQTKAKMRAKRKLRPLRGKDNPMYGVKHTEEAIAKMTASTNAYYENNPGAMLGKNHSKETKAKMRASSKPHSAEHRAKLYSPSITCIHCKKFVTKSQHTQYHGNNCKYKY